MVLARRSPQTPVFFSKLRELGETGLVATLQLHQVHLSEESLLIAYLKLGRFWSRPQWHS